MNKFKRTLCLGVFGCAIMGLSTTNVNALTIDEQIAKKELTIKSIPITSDHQIGIIDEKIISKYSDYQHGIYYSLDNCNNDYSECDLVKNVAQMNGPSQRTAYRVKMNYVYDKDVKKVVDNIMKKIPQNGISFELNDIEAAHYFKAVSDYYRSDENATAENQPHPIKFSSAYNKFVGYKNFIFEPRMGYDSDYVISMGGSGEFMYDDTIYGYGNGINVRASLVLYVDSNETNPVQALKTRLSKYFDNVNVIKDDAYGPVTEYNNMIMQQRQSYNVCKGLKDYLVANGGNYNQEYSEKMNQYNYNCMSFGSYQTADFSNEDEYISNFEKDMKANEWWFIDKVENAYYEVSYSGTVLHFLVIKDSSKVFKEDIKVITSDTETGVEIATDSVIPLDTLIQVARVTTGEEYEKIVNILNAKNFEMFDLKLFSKSSNEYITRLDDGTFEVKLPISDALKDKDLVVYYVKDDNTVEEYPVTIKDGYAVFRTNHFSVYTLVGQDKNGIVSTSNKVNNPKTGDNIISYVLLLILSLFGLIGTRIYTKKI